MLQFTLSTLAEKIIPTDLMVSLDGSSEIYQRKNLSIHVSGSTNDDVRGVLIKGLQPGAEITICPSDSGKAGEFDLIIKAAISKNKDC